MKLKIQFILLSILSIYLSGCDVEQSTESLETSLQTSEDNKSTEEIEDEEEEEEVISYEINYKNASTYENSIGTIWINTIYEVENTGEVPLYLNSASCDIEDTDGKLVKALSMVSVYPSVIEAGEKAYYYESTTLNEFTEEIEVVPLPRVNIDKAKVPTTRLEVSEIEMYDDYYGGIKARGRVENTTDEEQNMVYISMILFDENDDPAHVIFTILMEDLIAGDKIGFELSALSIPDEFTSSNVSRYEVYAYPMQMQF